MCGGDDGAEGEDGEEWEGRQGALRTEGQRGELTGEPQQQRGQCPCHTSVATWLPCSNSMYIPSILLTIYLSAA